MELRLVIALLYLIDLGLGANSPKNQTSNISYVDSKHGTKEIYSILNQIPELSETHVKISNPARVQEKIRKMHWDGKERLQVLSDFDQTLTVQKGPYFGTIEIFTHMEKTPEKVRFLLNRSARYTEYKMRNTKGSLDEVKVDFLDGRMIIYEHYLSQIPWNNTLQLLQEEVIRVIKLRDGVEECLSLLHESTVPFTILSSTYVQVIEFTLKHHHIDYNNIRIIANRLKFKDGKLIGFTDKFFHFYIKNKLVENLNIKDLIKRDNIILLGDWLTDIHMADSAPDSATKLSIGFLNEDVDLKLKSFMDTFDVVIIQDKSMDIVNAIFRFILSGV